MANGPADRIEALLKERGWSMRELARRAGKHPSQGANILARLRKNPGAIENQTAEAIAGALEVPVTDIFFLSEPRVHPAVGEVDVADASVPLMRALWSAARRVSGVEPEDYDAARAVAAELQHLLVQEASLEDFAETLLRCAGALRREGRATTVVAILGRAAQGRALDDGEHPAVSAALEAAAEEQGRTRGERRDVVDQVRAKVRASTKSTSE